VDQCSFSLNDLPEVVKNNSKPVLFADDTSVIVSNPDLVNFKNDLTFSFEQLNAWFSINILSLNYDKTRCILNESELIFSCLYF
jgi:hypothetical protein